MEEDQAFPVTMNDEKQPLLVGAGGVDLQEAVPVYSAPPLTPPPAQPSPPPRRSLAPPKEFDLAEARDLEHPTSNLDTLIHLLKGNIGTGILAMPDAFKNAGWVVGIFGTLLMGVICTHCMHILVECSHELCMRNQRPALSFSEVVEDSFLSGPIALRPYAKKMKTIVNTFLCITQLGFCCVYFLFVATNLQDAMEYFHVSISIHWYLVIVLVPLIFINMVKNLKYLTPISLVASILTLFGLFITFLYLLKDLPRINTIKHFATWHQLPLYFGTAIYAFEGIGMVLPLENNMKTPDSFGGWNGVLNTGMVIVASLYTAVGFFGYLKYGEAVRGSITLNLPNGVFLAQSVRAIMAAAIFLSYGLQFYVPMNIIWPLVKERLSSEKALKHGENVTRLVLMLITFFLIFSTVYSCIEFPKEVLVSKCCRPLLPYETDPVTAAAMIPNLSGVISLVGAVSSSTLALIFPPIIEIVTFWPDRLGQNRWRLWKDLAIMTFGITGFLFGSYASLENLLRTDLN